MLVLYSCLQSISALPTICKVSILFVNINNLFNKQFMLSDNKQISIFLIMQREQRLSRELKKISESPPPGISVTPKDNKLNLLEAQIMGPENTPYQSGIFNLEILVPENYPFSPPSIKFLTKIYHPNIDDNGRICLDLIKMPPKGNWRPIIGIENLLIAIRMLLENPNPDDPLMADIAAEFINDKNGFEKKAEEYCKLHAN